MKHLFPSFLYRVKNKRTYNGVDQYYFFIHTGKGQKMLFTERAIRQALARADEQPEYCIHGKPIDVKKAVEERNEFLTEAAKISAKNFILSNSLSKFKAGFFLAITGLPIGTFLLGLYFDKFVDFFTFAR
jgi:hypothetical protein